MKIFKVIFGVCLGVLALYGSRATAVDDMARAATRGIAQNTTNTTNRGNQPDIQKTNTLRATSVRNTSDMRPSAKSRTTTAPKLVQRTSTSGNVVSRSTSPKSGTRTLGSRNATRVQSARQGTRGAATMAATLLLPRMLPL